jgi:hypothetical protein
MNQLIASATIITDWSRSISNNYYYKVTEIYHKNFILIVMGWIEFQNWEHDIRDPSDSTAKRETFMYI